MTVLSLILNLVVHVSDRALQYECALVTAYVLQIKGFNVVLFYNLKDLWTVLGL